MRNHHGEPASKRPGNFFVLFFTTSIKRGTSDLNAAADRFTFPWHQFVNSFVDFILLKHVSKHIRFSYASSLAENIPEGDEIFMGFKSFQTTVNDSKNRLNFLYVYPNFVKRIGFPVPAIVS